MILQEVANTNIISKALDEGGTIHPLLVNASFNKGLGLMNPSILKDGKDTLINVRATSYTLHHCDSDEDVEGKFQTPWGPLNYVRPDNDTHLRTVNYIGYLDRFNTFIKYHPIDTSSFPKLPLWDFVGHEDGRLVKWDNKLWLTGVRRHAPDGRGRMQLSEIKLLPGKVKELSRHIIEVEDKDSYCEKNWMPILDMPFHYVRWLDPFEIVKVDLDTNEAFSVMTGDSLPISNNLNRGVRGGSQVVSFKDYRIAITHDVDGWTNEKGDRNAHYNHRMIVWDQDWNIISITKPWKFMEGKIEFCCGLAIEGDQLEMTFGFQDNAAYLFRTSWDYMNSLEKEGLI